MEIRRINCHCTKEEWLALFEKSFIVRDVLHRGHYYIYLNQTGILNAFASLQQASQHRFYWKLTVDDIVRISQELFKDYEPCKLEELYIVQRVYQMIDQGAQCSWWSSLIHWFRGLGFKNTHQLIEHEHDQVNRHIKSLESQKQSPENQKPKNTPDTSPDIFDSPPRSSRNKKPPRRKLVF